VRIIPLLALVPLVLAAHPDPRHTFEEIQSHLAQSPNDPELLRQKAGVYLDVNQPDEAAAVVAILLQLGPEDPENLLVDARITLAKGEKEAAAIKARALVARHAKHERAWRFLATAEEAAGRRPEAIAALRTFLDLSTHPGPSEVLTCAGWLQERGATGDAEAAIAVLDQGLAKIGCLTGLHHKAIEIELGLGRYDPALRRIDALTARFRPSVDLSLRRAEILEKAGRFQEAAAACDAALALLDILPASRKLSDGYRRQFEAVTKRKAENLERAGG
jgi:predicted Zn-dependent protease